MNIKWDIKLSLHVERPGEWVRADQKGCSACSDAGNNTHPHQIKAKRQGFLRWNTEGWEQEIPLPRYDNDGKSRAHCNMVL